MPISSKDYCEISNLKTIFKEIMLEFGKDIGLCRHRGVGQWEVEPRRSYLASKKPDQLLLKIIDTTDIKIDRKHCSMAAEPSKGE